MPTLDERRLWFDRWTFMRAVAHRRVPRLSQEDLDDVAQESCVRLQRALSRPTPIGNLPGLMTTIAQRTAYDIWARQRGPVIPVDPSSPIINLVPHPGPLHPVTSDVRSRIRFVVLQYFREEHGACAKLARALFRGVTWKELAGQHNMSEAAIRQRWSRVCLRSLRQKARSLGLDIVYQEWLDS
jgi:DNA-directed RNA polymerase specialized sigma24 family protein